MAEKKIYNVGIDLGTSRSVIACDNGIRTFIPSYVGFPRDAVSAKMLGKKIVFGEEVIKNRLALNLYRPIEKGVLKYSDNPKKNPEGYEETIHAAKELLAYLVGLVTKGDKGDFLVRGVIGTPALASMKNKQALIELSKGILDDVLITSEPFAVAYGLNMFTNSLIIDIGAGTVDMCRMHGTIPNEEDQITTFNAGDHIDQILLEQIKKKHKNVNLTVNMIRKFKEENAFISDQDEKVFIELPVEGKPVNVEVTEELREACRSIVSDIVEGVKKLIATFDPEFQSGLKENVFLAGGGSQIIGLKKEIENYMKDKLGYGKVKKVEEPLYAGANGALMLCRDMPDDYWDELKSRTKKPKKPAESIDIEK